MTTVIYPGSFDPITFGHLDVIERTVKTFGKVVIGVLINSNKTPMFSVEERMSLIRTSVAHLPNVEIVTFSGLLVNYMKSNSIDAIVKGLRNFTDFEYEYKMSELNRRLSKQAETYFVMTDNKFAIVSSSMVKEVAKLGGSIDDFVPKHVKEAVIAKINQDN
jgi:pantetheine-phosphate adenylyltransferase